MHGAPRSDRVRVTHVVGDLHEGGYETLIAAMARHFEHSPIEMSAVSLSGRVGRVGGAITPLLKHYEIVKPKRLVSMVYPRSVITAIQRTEADVVHLHSGCWFKGSLAAKFAGTKGIMFTEHGRTQDDPLNSDWIDRLAAKRTDLVIAVSDRLATYMKHILHVPASRVRVIQNGVDTTVFSPGPKSADLRRKLGIPGDALIIGSIGRLDAVKAYERLIDAVAALRESRVTARPVVGVIWGEGPERATLEARVASRGLGSAFLLPGWTEDAAVCHRLLDIFTLTSLSEGASVSLMESMSCGVCPVVMDAGANAEVAGPELQAQVVPSGNLEALRETYAATLRDDARRAAAGEAARRRVIAAYSLDAMLGNYERVYRELAGK